MNAEENRIQVLFDEKPDEEMRGALKSNGFKWAPSKNAWQRVFHDPRAAFRIVQTNTADLRLVLPEHKLVCPVQNAWQRQLNENGIRALRRIARIQPENA